MSRFTGPSDTSDPRNSGGSAPLSGAKADQAQFDQFAAQGGFENIFNSSYRPAYAAFGEQFLAAAKSGHGDLRVVDIGCGDGWTAEMLASLRSGTYVGIDTSGVSLGKLVARMDKSNLACVGFEESGEWVLSEGAGEAVEKALGGRPNLFICNATGHQLRKVYPDVGEVLRGAIALLEPGSEVVVGDYYYPLHLDEATVEASRDSIRAGGQNPTVRGGFIQPTDIRSTLERAGVEIIAENDVQANDSICLRYYVFRGRVRA